MAYHRSMFTLFERMTAAAFNTNIVLTFIPVIVFFFVGLVGQCTKDTLHSSHNRVCIK